MDANGTIWGLEEVGGSLTGFPVGGTVLEPVHFHEGIFADLDRLLADGRCPEGRFEVEAGDTRLTCLIHQSAPYVAGLQERDVYSQVPLEEFASRVRQLSDAICTLVSTDNACVLMVGVHFCKRPYLQGSTRLVNPAHVLRVLEKEKKDAALAFERGGTRTLLFLNKGEPARLYFGDPRDDPGEGTLSDRILLYAFADSAPASKVEVYTSLQLPADPARGLPFVKLAESTRPPPPVVVHVRMAGGREIRQRVFAPPAMVIGRDPTCTLFIDNLAVSRQHARLTWDQGHFVIEDLGSANGTKVNGERIRRSQVHPGDHVQVGKFEILLQELPSKPTAPQTVLMLPKGRAAPRSAALVGDRQTVEVAGNLVVGRGAGVDVRARGFAVRPVHARIVADEQGRLEIRCFGRNRVTINGEKVVRGRLEVGDVLAVGRSHFELVELPAEARE